MVYFLLIACSMVLWLASTADAATYWVAKTGSDSRSCTQAQSASTPKMTIRSGLSCLSPGDTLLIRGGTYNEEVTNIPSGSSWSNPITISPHPGETVTIPRITADGSYVAFDGTPGTFIVDGQQYYSVGVNIYVGYVRFKNLEVRNNIDHGLIGCGKNTAGHCEFINLKVHDNGFGAGCAAANAPGYCHGLYSDGDGNLVDGGEWYNNNGFGLQLSPSPINWIVRNVRLHDNVNGGILEAAGSDGNNRIYNNLVYNNGGWGGITVQSNSYLYHNTVYGNTGAAGIYALWTGNDIRNNIVYNNSTNIAMDYPESQMKYDHNLTTNPPFVNAAGGDFHLQSGSPAIDAGVNMSAVTTDFDKRPRPQGAGFDIGAYEYPGSPPSPPSAPTNLRIVGQ
jgi:hypothetical protein